MKTFDGVLKKDRSGEWIISYELDGFAGLSCDEVATALAAAGTLSEKKLTDGAYAQEVPVPVPNRMIS
jgi:hypothetical protein